MPSMKIDFDVVRVIAMALPDVEESTIHGAPSLKVRGRLLTCPALHGSAEPNTLAVRIDFDQRAELMAAEPHVYYVTDHYVNYPNRAGATVADRPGLLTRFAGYGLALRELKDEKGRTEGPESAPRDGWLTALAAGPPPGLGAS